MQLMTWMMGRLGSRFSLLFEPYQKRVLHSALGRFLDEPVDLMVGLVEPDGTERVLPFTTRGAPLFNTEQFDRMNSITFRGYSERYALRFEFNVHSVFYPQNEALCVMPAFYLEIRISPAGRVRWSKPVGPVPRDVKLFIRLRRPHTQITAQDGRIDLVYRSRLEPRHEVPADGGPVLDPAQSVEARERIVSLTPGAKADPDGQGLTCEIPVTAPGSGIKWRLVWGAHVGEPVLTVGDGPAARRGRFRYVRHYPSIDAVMDAAVTLRDDRLAHSRRFEKLFDQAPLHPAQRHLVNQGFQNYLSNTFWCDLEPRTAPPGGAADKPRADESASLRGDNGRGVSPDEWFSVWEGSCFFHSTVDVEYNVTPLYLALWPRLLLVQLHQWPAFGKAHEPSGGGILSHDMGRALSVGRQSYPHDMPVEENSNYLLMLQAYAHWTGDLSPAQQHAAFVEQLARYLLWTDRDDSGFPSEGVANTIDDANPAVQYARKQTYLAIKRVAALEAAADLLARVGKAELAEACENAADAAAPRIEQAAWLGDHYAVCVDRSAAGVVDCWTGEPLPYDEMPGWDAYSIYTGNGLLLPAMIGLTCPLDVEHLSIDLINAMREAMGRYGCGHTSYEVDNVWVSQNLWRDQLSRYLGLGVPAASQYYWDLQVMSNTHAQSLGFIDTYINNYLCFYPRGIASMGHLLAGPRLVMDRLAPGGARLTVEPDKHYPQRWPLLPLADWKAGKIPVCVVDARGRVTIEGQIDPIIVRGGGPAELIG